MPRKEYLNKIGAAEVYVWIPRDLRERLEVILKKESRRSLSDTVRVCIEAYIRAYESRHPGCFKHLEAADVAEN